VRYCPHVVAVTVGNKLLMLFFPFLRKWTYARMHEQVRHHERLAGCYVGVGASSVPGIGRQEHASSKQCLAAKSVGGGGKGGSYGGWL
jgi:hypothetical protein